MGWSDEGSQAVTIPSPHELLDDGTPVAECDLVVIGCGNILRGDDSVGPVLIRHLFTRGAPDGVRLVDGGTAGMDVAFAMRGAQRVVIVDAAQTGAEPGTIYRVPAEEFADLPPIDGLHTHNFRWDHALSFSSWLLGPLRPTDITVLLVEAESFEPGAALTERVKAAMHTVADLVAREHYPPPTPGEGTVEITDAGYLHLDADLAARRFPSGLCLAIADEDVLRILPVAGAGHGGLVLKQRNTRGDMSLLIHEALGFRDDVAGIYDTEWDERRGSLLVPLGPQGSDSDGRVGHPGDHGRGDPEPGPVGGAPRRHDDEGGGPSPRRDAPDEVARGDRSESRPPDHHPSQPTTHREVTS